MATPLHSLAFPMARMLTVEGMSGPKEVVKVVLMVVLAVVLAVVVEVVSVLVCCC
jgi:hypothetical protein